VVFPAFLDSDPDLVIPQVVSQASPQAFSAEAAPSFPASVVAQAFFPEAQLEVTTPATLPAAHPLPLNLHLRLHLQALPTPQGMLPILPSATSWEDLPVEALAVSAVSAALVASVEVQVASVEAPAA
jgi:hypothetical protein